MMYPIIRNLLFKLPPELAHAVTLKGLNYLPSALFDKEKTDPVELMGLTFPNRIGLAAGLDKNGDYIEGLAKLGFGFLEIGTTTPKPQSGNPKPRLFRLPEHQAIINRMGFNNKGVNYLVEKVKASRYQGILGINIGKNKQTPTEDAVTDYLVCLAKVYPHASYVAVNISSPNTPGLRALQTEELFATLIAKLKQEQMRLANQFNRYVPMVVKISPDETFDTLSFIASSLIDNDIDGVIATNTSCERDAVRGHRYEMEAGGLSGAVLHEKSCQTIRMMAQLLDNKIPLIGVGGIMDEARARLSFEAGAQLLQVYSGLIYQGPALIKQLIKTAVN